MSFFTSPERDGLRREDAWLGHPCSAVKIKKARVSFKSLASEEGDEKLIESCCLIYYFIIALSLLIHLSHLFIYNSAHRSSIGNLLNANQAIA
jgi:hypothetical protein